ncbi:MAG: aspartate dehydrogenase [Candidatus Omnitrophica bacterium]|nr:aspartate dehydrogenase [Candidatus Omnitrophota bacterium]
MMLKVGLVGCGTIGTALARAIDRDLPRQARLVALTDRVPQAATRLQRRLRSHPAITTLPQLIRRSRLVIEAASPAVAIEVARRAIAARRDLLIMSAGGILQHPELLVAARRAGIRVHLPSGAVAGLDALKALRLGRIDRVTLTTRKPPQALRGAPYFTRRRINVDAVRKETLLFDGKALDAVRAFPHNINVAATIALAGVGPQRTRVRIIAVPRALTNSHEVEVVGEFGRLVARTDNVPSAQNPKTSALAVQSAIATIRGVVETIRIGT